MVGRALLVIAPTLGITAVLVHASAGFTEDVSADFYVVAAEVIPVLLLALLLRHKWTNDLLGEVLEQKKNAEKDQAEALGKIDGLRSRVSELDTEELEERLAGMEASASGNSERVQKIKRLQGEVSDVAAKAAEKREELARHESELTERDEEIELLWSQLTVLAGGRIVTSLVLAIWAEASALTALAIGASSAWTLVPVVVGLAWTAGSLVFLEVEQFQERLMG